MSLRCTPLTTYEVARGRNGDVAPPDLVCCMTAMICGLANNPATSAASAAGHSLAAAGRRSSHGRRAAPVKMITRTAISWSVSRAPPTTSPSTSAWRQPGRRLSRTAASSASGKNSTPAARFRWYQARQVSIAERPKNAPAAIAPACEGSHSRATRYIA